jgi:hypothetical protein
MSKKNKLRDEFEVWVNNSHMLNRRTEPGYTDEYEHPWTKGAWEAWKECHKRLKQDGGKLLPLYHAVNELMAYMGAHGSAEARGDRAQAVMDALHAIDGGQYQTAKEPTM